MKVDSADGKKMWEALTSTEVGQQVLIDTPSLLMKFKGAPVDLFLSSRLGNAFILTMFWYGISCGDVSAERHKDELIFEAL